MKRSLLVVALLAGLPVAGLSQALPLVPRVAVSGSFTRVFDQGDANSYSAGTFHFDGFEASGEVKVTRWVGVLGDYGCQWSLRDGQVLQKIALIGPQFSPDGVIHRELIPFAHVLVGYVHGTFDWGGTRS